MKFFELAADCLDDNPLDNYDISRNKSKEVNLMKVKTTFYNHNSGKDYDPLIRVKYPKSRTDQLSFSPTAKLVDQMFKTGQMVQASKQAYDFPDGKDDGREVPFDRMRGLDYSEISQAMLENEKKLKAHKKRLNEISAAEKEKKDSEKSEQSANDNGATKGSDGGSGGSGSDKS